MKANCKSEDLDRLRTRCEILVRNCVVGLLGEMADEEFLKMEGLSDTIQGNFMEWLIVLCMHRGTKSSRLLVSNMRPLLGRRTNGSATIPLGFGLRVGNGIIAGRVLLLLHYLDLV